MTKNQKATLDFIRAYICIHGIAPSYAEIMEGTKKKSKSEVHRSIVALERLGQLRREAGRTRSLELTGPDANARTLSQVTLTELNNEVRRRGYVMGAMTGTMDEKSGTVGEEFTPVT